MQLRPLTLRMLAAMAAAGASFRGAPPPPLCRALRELPLGRAFLSPSPPFLFSSQPLAIRIPSAPHCASLIAVRCIASAREPQLGFEDKDIFLEEEEEEEAENVEFVQSGKSFLRERAHPWPEWGFFLLRLHEQGYQKTVDAEGRRSEPGARGGEGPFENYSEMKHAVMNFGRDRDDMFERLPEEHLRVIAAAGCPDVERKLVNSAKRLRAHVGLTEDSVCTPCSLRESCSRAFAPPSGTSLGTAEVVRLILSYATRVGNAAALDVAPAVQDACRALLSILLKLSEFPRDPSLPRKEEPVYVPKKPSTGGSEWRRDAKPSGGLQRRSWEESRGLRSAYEPLPGDWPCPSCGYNNYARNQECRQCNVERPGGNREVGRGPPRSEWQPQGSFSRERSEWGSQRRESRREDEPRRSGMSIGGRGRDGEERERGQSWSGARRGGQEGMEGERRGSPRRYERQTEPEWDRAPMSGARRGGRGGSTAAWGERPIAGKERRDFGEDFDERRERSRPSEESPYKRPSARDDGRAGRREWGNNNYVGNIERQDEKPRSFSRRQFDAGDDDENSARRVQDEGRPRFRFAESGEDRFRSRSGELNNSRFRSRSAGPDEGRSSRQFAENANGGEGRRESRAWNSQRAPRGGGSRSYGSAVVPKEGQPDRWDTYAEDP